MLSLRTTRSFATCFAVVLMLFQPGASTCKRKSTQLENFDHMSHNHIVNSHRVWTGPHDHNFCFEHDSINWYNFARFDMGKANSATPHVIDYGESNDDMAAIGGVVNFDAQTIDMDVGYLSTRAGSDVGYFDLHSFKFFCLKDGMPHNCTVGITTARGEDAPLSTAQLYTFTPGKLPTPIAFASIPADTGEAIKFAAIGIPVAQMENDATLSFEALTAHRYSSGGVTMYIDDMVYTMYECDERNDGPVLAGAMQKLHFGFGECQD